VQPIWAPDGSGVAFTSNATGKFGIWKRNAGGGASELLLDTQEDFISVRDWSHDGRSIAYVRASPETGWDIWALPLPRAGAPDDRKPFPLVVTNHNEREPVFSPDARWIAYQSDETGRFEIYAQPFPGPGGRVQISNSGGAQPRWRADGREIFYIAPDRALMAAPVVMSPDGKSLAPQAPVRLFQTRIAGGAVPGAPNKQQYDVSSDGQRFIINTLIEETSSSPITVILNWTARSRISTPNDRPR